MGGVMGMCICNDRRWPETYRVMGLQGVELVMLGYNTPNDHTGYADIDGLSLFHNHLSMQAGAYQNATWVVGVAKCGCEEGSNLIGESAIIAPSGEIVAMASTIGDELITARCDLDFGKRYRETIFDFRAPPPATALSPDRRAPGSNSAGIRRRMIESIARWWESSKSPERGAEAPVGKGRGSARCVHGRLKEQDPGVGCTA